MMPQALSSVSSKRALPAYLAFDLGASSSRALLGIWDGERMHLEEVHRFVTPIVEEGERLYWDLDTIERELEAGFRTARDATDALRSVSVDAWGVDYVPLDADDRPLRRPFCYRDTRTHGMMDRAFGVVPAAEIYRQTGIQFLPFNTLYQVLADQASDPEALRRVHRHAFLADYLHYRLCGVLKTEISIASTSQMMEAGRPRWARPLMDAFGLDARQWTEIVPSGTVLGPLHADPGVQVVATCSHDTGCAVAAAPATPASGHWAYISCGTWSLLGVERTAPLVTEAARRAGYTHEAGVDGTIRFLKNLTGLWSLQECMREWNEAGQALSWAALIEEARAAGPAPALITLEDDRFLARGGMEARLRGWLTERGLPDPASRGVLARIVLESIADSYRRALLDLEDVLGETIDTIHLFGGGSQNDLLCACTAAACGRRVVAGPAEATALGNLLIQARAMGDLPADLSLHEAAARSSDLATYGQTAARSPKS
ncbi:MAG: rhamnulokinase family protein [Rhodothermales bacterium]